MASHQPAAAVVGGPLAELDGLADLVEAALAHAQIPIRCAGFADAHAGAHELYREQEPLPYDCGFIVRKPSTPFGVGTLVLIRGQQIGDSRISNPIEHRAENGETLEVAVYIRRVELDSSAITYEELESRRFAADPGEDGTVRLHAQMRVNPPASDSGQVTVSIRIDDLKGGRTISFERLGLRAVARLDRLPLRTPSQLAGAIWADNLEQIRRQLPHLGRDLSVEQWLGALRGGGQKVSRRIYAISVLQLIGPDTTSQLASETFIAGADPEEFQAEVRLALFAALQRMAKQYGGGAALRRWRQTYRADAKSPPAEVCSRDLVNALSQDNADQAAIELASQLQRSYHLACSPARSLNVAW